MAGPDARTLEASGPRMTASASSGAGAGDLDVGELNLTGGKIIGILTNSGTTKVSGAISVYAFCFSADGKVLGDHEDFATPGTADPGGHVSFQVDTCGHPCPIYLVSGRGFGF
jgi:hypothetical protein